MRKGGKEVVAVVKSHAEVMKMLDHVVLSEQMTKNKAAGKLMSKVEKVAYVTKWKKKNKLMLVEGGVWPLKGGKHSSRFVQEQCPLQAPRCQLGAHVSERPATIDRLLAAAAVPLPNADASEDARGWLTRRTAPDPSSTLSETFVQLAK